MSIVAAAVFSVLFAAAAPVAPPGVDAGARLAAQRCASCHAIGPTGRSPNFVAPTFRDIRLRYNSLSLERELAKISQKGHFEMRPLSINAGQASDLAAYIESLTPPKR